MLDQLSPFFASIFPLFPQKRLILTFTRKRKSGTSLDLYVYNAFILFTLVKITRQWKFTFDQKNVPEFLLYFLPLKFTHLN